jgi:hypothetical protein
MLSIVHCLSYIYNYWKLDLLLLSGVKWERDPTHLVMLELVLVTYSASNTDYSNR